MVGGTWHLSDGEKDDDADNVFVCEGDCNDADVAIHPFSPELCNDEIDNDCDTEVDEDVCIATGGCNQSGTESMGAEALAGNDRKVLAEKLEAAVRAQLEPME